MKIEEIIAKFKEEGKTDEEIKAELELMKKDIDAYLGDNKYDFTPMFEFIPDLIKDYDLKYCNQESIIGGKELGIFKDA